MARWWANDPSFDRVAILRHLALCAAAMAAYVWRAELHVGNSVLWIVGCAAALNLQPVLLSRTHHLGPALARLSPLFGLAGWLALMHLTGGATSPFAAGLWLEIVFAALATSALGVVLVACGAAVGLWGQQLRLGLDEHVLLLGFQTGVLLLVGALASFAVHRRERAARAQLGRVRELRERLTLLEGELNETRELGKLGENVAQLGHALKNAVHSLRGFTALIEPRLTAGERDTDLLDGMRQAIGRLEEISRATLRPNASPMSIPPGSEEDDVARTIRAVVRDVGACFPLVRWSVTLDTATCATAPIAGLREALTILFQNAAEAMDGQGEVGVELKSSDGRLEIRVRDHGPGIAHEVREKLFVPGATTKATGHGFGLFLARRLLEPHGGALRLKPTPLGTEGSLFEIELPLAAQGLKS